MLAGVATRDITKLEAKTSAYNALDQASSAERVHAESIECPVMAKALVLREQEDSVAIVTLDVVAIGSIGHVSDDFLPRFRARAASELGLPHLLVTASHCHGVPCDEYEELAFEALREAAGSCVAVSVGTGRAHEAGVSENRRLALRSGGEADMRQAYALPPSESVASVGAIDAEIGVLRIDRADGGTLAVVWNFACHPIQGVPSEANCADLSGYASRLIEEHTGGTALFLQGCAGDINPLGYKDLHAPRHAAPLGTTLGLSVLRGLRAISAVPAASLRLRCSSVALPRVRASERIAQLEAQLRGLVDSLEGGFLDLEAYVALRVKHSLSPRYPSQHASRYMHDRCRGCDDLPLLDAQNAAHLRAYERNCRAMEQITRLKTNLALLRKHAATAEAAAGAPLLAELNGLRVGDFVLLTFPGEVSSSIGMALKRASPHEHTFIGCYTNGYIFYTPTEGQHANCCTAQEDCDCMVAPGWRAAFEEEARKMLAAM